MKFKIETNAQFVVKCFDCGLINRINFSSFFGDSFLDLVKCNECEAPIFYFDEHGVIEDTSDCEEWTSINDMQCAKERAITGTDKDADLWREIFEEEKEDKNSDDD